MFKMISSPHTHSNKLTSRIMLWVIVAMIPALITQFYYFGYGVLVQSTIAVGLAIVLEMVVAKLRNKSLGFYVADLSGVLTALILAMSIPPYAPYWIIVIGILTALLLAKHSYGGLGQNLFNPAMVAYALLLVSFPLQMSSWLPPLDLINEPPTLADSVSLILKGITGDGFSVHQLLNSIDGVSQATPLDSVKTGLKNSTLPNILSSPIFYGNLASGWWQVNVAFLAGGMVLVLKRIIHWQIPVAMLVSFSLLSGITMLIQPDSSLGVASQLLSGAMMFGAFFIATDPVSASITPKGKLIFGALIGLLVYLIRYYGNYPDGVAFAVLLANITVPLIDYYTRPRVYGYQLGRKK